MQIAPELKPSMKALQDFMRFSDRRAARSNFAANKLFLHSYEGMIGYAIEQLDYRNVAEGLYQSQLQHYFLTEWNRMRVKCVGSTDHPPKAAQDAASTLAGHFIKVCFMASIVAQSEAVAMPAFLEMFESWRQEALITK
jgi:hypothetical protein